MGLWFELSPGTAPEGTAQGVIRLFVKEVCLERKQHE